MFLGFFGKTTFFSAKNILLSEQFETPMNIEIVIVRKFCDFGHNLKKQPFWPFFIRILAINCEKNLSTLEWTE